MKGTNLPIVKSISIEKLSTSQRVQQVSGKKDSQLTNLKLINFQLLFGLIFNEFSSYFIHRNYLQTAIELMLENFLFT